MIIHRLSQVKWTPLKEINVKELFIWLYFYLAVKTVKNLKKFVDKISIKLCLQMIKHERIEIEIEEREKEWWEDD